MYVPKLIKNGSYYFNFMNIERAYTQIEGKELQSQL